MRYHYVTNLSINKELRWYKYTFNDIILMGCEKIINKYLHLTFVDAE